MSIEKGEILIRAENVSKKFCRSLKRSLWYGGADIVSSMFNMEPGHDLRKDEFWAVRNVSFEVRRGECLGLIGHNGAGKSTLLKMLNGLIRPDEGRIEMCGKIGALIELGAGFNPILTGRENVYNNGAILGFTKEQIDAKFDEIVAFAELQEFIDMPVQNYSSGMKVRLGFAVAAQMEPDILIIDEVLAVGDMGFKLKCFNLIDKLLPNTCIIFVSHSMPMISRISSQLMLMESGQPVYSGGNISYGIDKYYERFGEKITSFQRTSGEVELVEIRIKNSLSDQLPLINHGDDLCIQFKLKVLKKFATALAGFIVYDKEQRPIGTMLNEAPIPYEKFKAIDENYYEVDTCILSQHINLSKGIYSLTFFMSEASDSNMLVRLQSVLIFQVTSKRDIWPPIEFTCSWV